MKHCSLWATAKEIGGVGGVKLMRGRKEHCTERQLLTQAELDKIIALYYIYA